VKGFSLTLAIGVLVSMFTAIVVTRTFSTPGAGPRPVCQSTAVVWDLGDGYATDCQASLSFLWNFIVGDCPWVDRPDRLGLPLGIDFTGGSILQARFASGQAPEPSQLIALYAERGFGRFSGADIFERGDHCPLQEYGRANGNKHRLRDGERFNSPVEVQRFDSVGPAMEKR